MRLQTQEFLFWLIRIFCFLGYIGRALEGEGIAVGVFEVGDPHAVADKGFGGGEAAGDKFMIEGEGVFALATNGYADASFFGGGTMFFTIFLQHKGDAVALQPAPFDGAPRHPLVGHGKAKPIQVELQGCFHVHYHEEGYSQLYIKILHFR